MVRDDRGKIRLWQLHSLTVAGAASGGFWGMLVGLLFLNPLFGFAVGAAAGSAVSVAGVRVTPRLRSGAVTTDRSRRAAAAARRSRT